MAQSLSTLNQIAAKRLSGKAMTSAITTLAGEKFGSTVQTLNSTVFGEVLPNNPDNTWATAQYLIQSESNSDPGTVMLVEFELRPDADSAYDNDSYDDLNSDAGENPFGDITEGPSSVTYDNTYHAYHLRLPDDFETQISQAEFDANASTPVNHGTGKFTNSYHLSASRGTLQVVPSYASNIAGTTNPYNPYIVNTNGTQLVAGSTIDWYLDTYAGILFVQDPVSWDGIDGGGSITGTPDSDDNIPDKIRAFVYVGKLQNEITFTASDVNFIVSGSDEGFAVANDDTINFVSGSAGITVLNNGTDTITIGASTDNVTFNQITASIINADIIEASEYIVSSSITYFTQSFSAGSTIFGDTNDDTHEFTGSLYILHTGSDYGITLTGSGLTINSGDGVSISASGFISASDLYLTNTFTALDGGVTVTTNTDPELYVDGNITASGDISASGLLFASASDANGASNIEVAMYNTTTGQFYYTGSSALGDTTLLEASASAGIRFQDDDSGFSLPLLTGTASFAAAGGDGLTVNVDSNTITYTLVGVLSSSQQIATDISGAIHAATSSLLTNYGLLSSSQQIATDISGAINIATGSVLSDYGLLSGSQQIATDISGAIGAATASLSASIVGTANEVEVTNGGTPGDIIIGLPDNVIIAGNLTVNGTTTSVNTDNLFVEDQFILLNSGAESATDTGIIVQTGATQNQGSALYWDTGNSRWEIDSAGADASNNSAAGDAAIVTVQSSNSSTPLDPYMGAVATAVGQMYVDTGDNDGDYNTIWIYA